MAKRDLYPVGIWAGVVLLHIAAVWAVSALWTHAPSHPTEIQWVQAVPLAGPTPSQISSTSHRPARLATPAPTQAQTSPNRSETVLTPTRPEPSPVSEPRSEFRALEGRATEAQTALASASAASVVGGPARAEPTPPSQSASYLHNPPPPYPVMSKRLGEQGRVVVRVYIDEQGAPKEAHLEVKSGYSRLDAAALEAVMSWRYVPARRGGVPLAMWFNVPVTFDLKSNKE